MKARPPAVDTIRYQTLLQILRTADALWDTSRVFFSAWDLSPSQFNILNLLSDQPNGLSQIQLSKLLIVHRSNVTGLVDRLEHRGLVRRTELANDRRAYRVVLTPDGRQLLRQVLPKYHELAQKVWAGFAANAAQRIAGDLTRLQQNAEHLITRKDAHETRPPN